MKRTLIALLLISTLVLTSCNLGFLNTTTSTTEQSEDPIEQSLLEFVLNEDGKSYTVAGIGACTDLEIIIPSTYNGLPVTAIADRAFLRCESIRKVVIPDSVVTIGIRAFFSCASLISAELGNSVMQIGNSAFAECVSLYSINIPNSVTTIGFKAFEGDLSLSEILIPESVTNIGEMAFVYCSVLTIYCEAESQPSGWSENWNLSDVPVEWGYSEK